MSGGGLFGGITSLLGGGLNFLGAQEGANAQIDAAKSASAVQLAMFGQTRKDLAAYRKFGLAGMAQLSSSMNKLTAPFQPTMQQLAKTPGYQFTLDQGLKAGQNSYAAQGLGESGVAIKGAEQYASGLASTTFQQQLQNYLAQNAQKYNMLMGMTQIGAGAAAGTAQAGQFAGAQVGANMIGAGNAAAAGWTGGMNALSSGLQGAAGYGWSMMNKMYPGA